MDGTCSTFRRSLQLRGSISWSCVREWNVFYKQALFGTERKNFVKLCSWMEHVLQTGAVWN